MASTGSIGMMRPMKKVTQVSPRNVSATENTRLMTRRMGPASRRTHSLGARTSGADTSAAVVLMGVGSCLRNRPVEIEVFDDAGLVAMHGHPRGNLVGRLEHDDERPLVGHRLLQF